MKSDLSIFFLFVVCTFSIIFAKPLPNQWSEILIYTSFLLSVFFILALTFRSLIHFGLIFVKGIRDVTKLFFIFIFIFLPLDVQLFQHSLLKRLTLLHCIAYAPLLKISWQYLWGSVSGLSIPFYSDITLKYLSILLLISHYLHFCSLMVNLEIGQCQYSDLFFFNIVLAILGLLPLHINFRISL